MALDTETIREAACQQWGKNLGLGDGMVAPVATCEGWCDVNVTPEMERFAFAIYEIGVQDERERCSALALYYPAPVADAIAEAIRKGEMK